MAQRKQLTWTELRVGLFVLVGMFILLVGIFYVTGVGIWRAKYQVRTYLPEVEGLNIGAPVRLDGVEAGNVVTIRMNPQAAGDRSRNIELILSIDRRYEEEIRTDSVASLITEGLLGNRYVKIKRGFTGEKIPNQGEVAGEAESNITQIVDRGLELVANLDTLTEHVNTIILRVQRGEGTVGKLLTDEALYNRVNSTVARAEQLVGNIQAGQGTMGKLLVSDELYDKLDSVTGRADTILADVQAQKGSLGKFMYDPSMFDNAKQFVERGNTMLGKVEQGEGTLGKLIHDDALYSNLRDAAANVNTATAKLNDNTGTAGKFFSDPAFYDNVTGLAGDMRLFMGEFRQNPKKFLRVKFSIF